MRRATLLKLAVGVVCLLAVANLGLRELEEATRSPGGPTSSSYATGPDGLAAYAELLRRFGHPIERVRSDAAQAELDARSAVVLLDPGHVRSPDARALRRFLERGGRVIAGGAEPRQWLEEMLDHPPTWSSRGPRVARALLPVPDLGTARSVAAAGRGSWSDAGGALPVLADGRGTLAVVATVGAGRLVLLADASPLQNAYLDDADNAAFGIAAAGRRERPVQFLESVHGYGEAAGVRAIPPRWWWVLGGSTVAALAWMLARGRRLGPPERRSRALPPPRRGYVEALGALLAKTRTPADATRAVRDEARAQLARRSGLPADAGANALRQAGTRLGLAADEVQAVVAGPSSEADVLSLGRALARLHGSAP